MRARRRPRRRPVSRYHRSLRLPALPLFALLPSKSSLCNNFKDRTTLSPRSQCHQHDPFAPASADCPLRRAIPMRIAPCPPAELRKGDLIPVFDDFSVLKTEEMKVLHVDPLT